AEQPNAGEAMASQVLLTDPVRVLGVRLEGWGTPRQRWGFAEIRLDAIEQGGPAPAPLETPRARPSEFGSRSAPTSASRAARPRMSCRRRRASRSRCGPC